MSDLLRTVVTIREPRPIPAKEQERYVRIGQPYCLLPRELTVAPSTCAGCNNGTCALMDAAAASPHEVKAVVIVDELPDEKIKCLKNALSKENEARLEAKRPRIGLYQVEGSAVIDHFKLPSPPPNPAATGEKVSQYLSTDDERGLPVGIHYSQTRSLPESSGSRDRHGRADYDY